MSKAIAVIDMPKTCAECFFCCTIQEISVGNGLYKKVGKCSLAKDIEDPWRDIYWQVEHKEEWCPLKAIPEIKLSKIPYEADYQSYRQGFGDCLDEILWNT